MTPHMGYDLKGRNILKENILKVSEEKNSIAISYNNNKSVPSGTNIKKFEF